MSVCLILSSSIPSRTPAWVLTSYCPPSTGPCWALQHLWVGGTSIGVDYWPLLLHCLGPCWALPGSINLTATAAMAGAHSCLRRHIWPVVIRAFVASQANVVITRFLWVKSSNTPYESYYNLVQMGPLQTKILIQMCPFIFLGFKPN